MEAPGADVPAAAPWSRELSEDHEDVFGSDGFGSDEAPEVSALALRLPPGSSTASSAGVWQTWPVCTPSEGGDGSFEEELAAAEELVVNEDLVPLAGEQSIVVQRDQSEVSEPKRLRVLST